MLTDNDRQVVTDILAQLHVKRWIRREEAPDMLRTEVRTEVERALAEHGLELAESPYSGYYSIRLSPRTRRALDYDWAGNVAWDANCYALLLIIWVRLALPRRVQRGQADVQASILFPETGQAMRDLRQEKEITYRQLYEEFGRRLGGRSKFNQYLRELKKRGFIDYTSMETIKEGPMLELLADGEGLAAHVRESLIPKILQDRAGQG